MSPTLTCTHSRPASTGPASTPDRRATALVRVLRVAAALAVASPVAAAQARPGDTPLPVVMQPEYRLVLRTLDPVTGKPTPARVRVIAASGIDAYPRPRESHFYHEAYSGHRYFYSDGECSLHLPQGRTIVWVSRGFEYWVERDTFDVVFGHPSSTEHVVERTIPLRRFADMPALGWRSGDTHVHTRHSGDDVYDVDRAGAFTMQQAEDLHVADLLEDAAEFTGDIEPQSTPDHLQYVGGEYRSAFWGHLDVLGTLTMPYLFCCSTGQPAYPMNVDLVRDARSRGGMVFFAHPITIPRSQMGVTDQGWPYVGHGRELPIDVALGTVDALDIYSYSNRNRIEFATWYDLLNHGFRIPATAGTDASVNRFTDPPMGGYRVYGRVGPGPFTHDAWLEALRRGESFVTNGPLIQDVKIAGAPPGSVVTMTSGQSFLITVEVDVVSQWPLTHVGVVVNGVILKYLYPSGDGRRIQRVAVTSTGGQSGWVAVVAYGTWANPGPFATFGTLLYAHSNPVYIDVPGLPQRFGGTDPLSYVRWIDDVWAIADARGWNAPAERDTVLARVTQARAIVLSRTYGGVPEAPEGPPTSEVPPVRTAAERRGGAIRFRFTDAPSAPETFDLFDVQGRTVVTRRLLQLDATTTGWDWHPERDARPIPAGIYFARFRGHGWRSGARVMLP